MATKLNTQVLRRSNYEEEYLEYLHTDPEEIEPDYAREAWRKTLSDEVVRSLVADYRSGMRGQDLEDAVLEYESRWPNMKSPAKVRRGQLIRCSKHEQGIPRYGCARCLELCMPHKRVIWAHLGIRRRPMMSDSDYSISEAIRRAS